jgi:two-component system, cell cycle response regulator
VRAVLAHLDPASAQQSRRALEGAGWDVVEVVTPDELQAACARGDVEAAFVHQQLYAAEPELLTRLKRRPDSFSTTVVLVAERAQTGVQEVLDALGHGASDVLLAPFTDADVVARAAAAARTRALVDELLERDERIEQLVFVDELTGLYNRRYLLHHMGMLVAASRRHGHDLACVMLDIDHFKQVNDTHGHPAGDDVLREVARAIGERLRAEDVAGRLGGDEFLVLLPDTDSDGARTVAEGIRQTVAAATPHAGGRRIKATVSVGWVTWHGEDRDGLLQRADAALYAAKAAGRDRIAAA